jgi:spore coat polysaccharide biosynthesis predicted glycosyltransferase SpsG
MRHRKSFLCYADGGGKMGLGHLSRLTTLSQKLNIQDKVVFLYDNLEQKIFYNSLSIDAQNITKFRSMDNEYKILFIDTKSHRPDIFESPNSFAD